ncbi:MAG: terminase large subunit domain-containing protein, partial [Caulobacteraceae bacterium]
MSWTPQPGPQAAFVASGVFEVVYGGARGGGKTDAALGDFSIHAQRFGPHAKGLLVRRTRVALGPTIARARAIFAPAGAVWGEARSAFVWPGGARLSCRYLDRDADADAYQGHDYSRVYVEELTQFADPRPVDKLKATLRSAGAAAVGFRATCNPGGPGHNWVKARYIDAGPWRVVVEPFEDPFGGGRIDLDRLFIPARLADNPALVARDPNYVFLLRQSGSTDLVRAWLDGDWSAVEGAFFDKWSIRNVVRPFAVPEGWTRFRSFDWGYAAPFSVGWWAVAGDDFPTRGGAVIPRGALVRYREWYGASGPRQAGLRLEAEAVAAGILAREAGEIIRYGVADPSIFRQDGGPSLAERMRRAGCA